MHGGQGSVTLQSFAVQEQVYPWEEGAHFTCDDEELNRIFTAGIRTVQLCSHDSFIDCPTREQRAWVGDGVVHQMVHLATNRDWRLAWHYLILGNSPRSDGMLPMSVVGEIEASGAFTIPDWALHWVHGVYNPYRFSADRDVVKGLMPTIERVLRWYVPYQTADGVLKDVIEWNLVDWSSVLVNDTSSILTALWARGLREYAEMAGWLEERGSQRWAEGVYEQARAGFEVFWDEARSSYVDHIVDGERRPEMSQLAGASAIISGLAPEARWGRIIDTITDTCSGPWLEGRALAKFIDKRRVVNRWLEPMGYDVSAMSKPWSFGPFGRDTQVLGNNKENRNRASANAVASLLLWIVRGRAVSKDASAAMMSLLERPLNPTRDGENQVKEFIGEALPPDVEAIAPVRREVHPLAVGRPRRVGALRGRRADDASD